jgi:hypothetical protein
VKKRLETLQRDHDRKNIIKQEQDNLKIQRI